MRRVAARPIVGFAGGRFRRSLPTLFSPAGRNVEHDELNALLAVCAADPRPAGARDAAIIASPTCPGAAGPNSPGYTWPTSTSTRPPSASSAKAASNALCPSPPPQLRPSRPGWPGNQPGPLFCPINRGDNVQHGRSLCGEAIRQVLGRRSLAAGVKALSPHDLRRSYAGDLLDAGADLPAVQQLLGHDSPATTSRFDRRGDKARTAAERLHLEIPTVGTDPDSSPD